MSCNFVRLSSINDDNAYIYVTSKKIDSKISNCFFYGCYSTSRSGVLCNKGNRFNFTKSNFYNSFCTRISVDMSDKANMLDCISFAHSHLNLQYFPQVIFNFNSNSTIKHLTISNCAANVSEIIYEPFYCCNISYFLMNNCYSLECFLTGVNTDPASSSFFKYISITKSKSAAAFICMTSYSNFENIYFQNVSCLRNIYFYTQYTVDINNCYSDVYFMAVGNCSMKNVLFNFTNTIPISGYYEEAILDYLLKESVTDTNKYASKPLTIKDLKGEIIIDTVIFENISSTNNGEAVSICCFSSNILITNCMFDQCTSNSFTQETSGGAIYIVGHNTYSNLRNVLSTNCQAGRCHFCYIYSNYLTSLTRTTVCKCAPDNYISDPDTLYIFYDNFFESCNISNNYMGLYLIYSFEDINFTDCVIASNTLVQGQCYIVGIEIKLDKCIIYNNTYHGPGNVTFSTFLIFNIEFNDCYLMVEDEFNPSNFTVINCTINNMTLEFINNLAISRQVGCNPKTIHIAESKFPAYKIIILGIIGLLVIALISIIVIISQHRTYKRLEERNNISNVIMNDFG